MRSRVYSPRESGYFPPGAEFDPSAPYNQVDPPEKDFDIAVSCSLSKDTTITTDDYDVIGDDYFVPNNALDDYSKEEYTIKDILNFAKHCAEYMLNKHDYSIKDKRQLKTMIDSCQGWTIDEENAEQL